MVLPNWNRYWGFAFSRSTSLANPVVSGGCCTIRPSMRAHSIGLYTDSRTSSDTSAGTRASLCSQVFREPSVSHGMVRTVLGFVIHTRHIISFQTAVRTPCGTPGEGRHLMTIFSHGHVVTIGVDIERTSDNLDILTEHSCFYEHGGELA